MHMCAWQLTHKVVAMAEKKAAAKVLVPPCHAALLHDISKENTIHFPWLNRPLHRLAPGPIFGRVPGGLMRVLGQARPSTSE